MEPLDLMTPVVPESAWHPNFRQLTRTGDEWIAAVLKQWATGFVDRDRKFVKEFQTAFNPCFWELYLNAVLRERGLSLDFSSSSPDFAITSPWEFTVEAVIASHAHGALPEHRSWEVQVPPDLNELNREAALRLSSALHAKYQKYKKHYAAKAHVAGRPFVIALASFDRPYFWLECQRPVEALLYNYYVDEQQYLAAGQPQFDVTSTTLCSVTKRNNSVVELGLFAGPWMPEVSAVVFNACATWGKLRALSDDPNPEIEFTALRFNPQSSTPHQVVAIKADYKETLLDGLRVYHNPYARFPLDPAVFRSDEVFQSYYRHDVGEWVHERREGHLLSRSVRILVRRGTIAT